jgi:hypothetical protein
VDAHFDLPSSDDFDWESDDDEMEDMLLLLLVQILHEKANRERKS